MAMFNPAAHTSHLILITRLFIDLDQDIWY